MGPANTGARGAVLSADGATRVFRTESEQIFGVRDVDLDLIAGEFVCLMGPSGCGKSTLISLLAGIDAPSAGVVKLDGEVISNLSPERRAALRLANIGLVFQDHRLVAEFTALENVMLPLELLGHPRKKAKQLALEALGSVGVGELGGRYPAELSGGQRQRVGIARAVVGDRRVVLADEATGALDHANSLMVFELLVDLARSGYAVLAVTHDPDAQSYADRTIRMVDGGLRTTDSQAMVSR